MKKINTRFSKVGTNPMHYFNNYLHLINEYEVGTSFFIDSKNYSLKHHDIVVAKFNSSATFRQNVDCWIGLGFVSKREEDLIKIIPPTNSANLMEISKIMLLMKSNEEKINIYRNTILTKILFKLNNKALPENELYMRERDCLITDIEHEFGEFEKMIMEDEMYTKLVNLLWGN